MVLSASLAPTTSDEALAAMSAEPLDVLVIGGGVVGAGCALDAITRGLSVGIVEATDWASGTSSRSSKLIHGGLRYLEMMDFRLVREALRERGLLLNRLAPHLVRPVPFLYPLRHRGWERWYVGAGVTLYDVLSYSSRSSRGVPWHRQLSRSAALRMCPALRADALTGAVRYYDAQVDDARLVMLLVRTAASFGARAASRASAERLLREEGRVVGAEVRDVEHDRRYTIRAKRVIDATGVWSDEIQALAGAHTGVHIEPSKGVHLMVPRDRIDSATALILRTATSVLLVIPWGQHWIIGTTDTPWPLDKAHPTASRRDIDYLLGEVNKVLARPLSHADIEAVYAGLRPLLAGESEQTAKLSREHMVASPMPGLVVVAGGKYTTYRVMAQDAVDAAVRDLYRGVPPSCTAETPLLGAESLTALWNRQGALARRAGLRPEQVGHLLSRYGTLVDEVLDLIHRDAGLGRPLAGAPGYLRAEVAYAVTAEGARHLDDVLERRTHIAIETMDRGMAAAAATAEIIAPLLGWLPEQASREVRNYERAVAAQRSAEEQSDDQAALAATTGVLVH